MDNAKESEDLVEKMIRKRKEENDAFKKLLDNIKQRQSQPEDDRPANENPKPSTNNSIL